MNISIKRFDNEKEDGTQLIEYEYDKTQCTTVLNALEYVKENQDESLAYRCGCESGICGSCSVRVNGVEKLACKTKINHQDIIEPLQYMEVIKDLVVDLKHEERVLDHSKSYLNEYQNVPISKEDEKRIDRQSNCILCQSCFSSCPVFEVNKNFLGPYALSRSLRYVEDKKEANSTQIIDAIQKDGIWDCTLCGNCTIVCPQFIDPKTDIMNLRMKSVQKGYSDPNMQDFSTINNEFNSGFDPGGNFSTGFNPNGF